MAVVVAAEGGLPLGAESSGNSPSTILDMAKSPNGRKIVLMIGIAAVIAVMIGLVLWGQKPEYRVLFSNFSDRDGGAIMTSLQAANVPYKFAEGGGAILVPADKVHEIRLKLAAEGLPKGGSVGFELMENQKLGVSQFLEQVNFQRALEGELARSIQSVGAIQAARVHLALPKASVFVRDQQKPTASVLLNLHPGRFLDQQQVSAIVHLVASSVPELSPKNVTIVDQAGNLLSENNKPAGTNTLDPSQLKYVQELQQSITKRIESIITPIVGLNNIRAEATADVDFSTSEQAAEVYKPNQVANSATVRSMQSSESSNGGNNATGVPGALTNQPAPAATAPLNTTPPPAPPGSAAAAAGTPGAAAATAAAGTTATPTQRDITTNYEVDKTVRYVQQPMGGLKRLSVAVVVNYKRVVGKDGKVSVLPLSEVEKTQITDLVKEAMGYNKDRGDTLNVVNSPFAGVDKAEAAKPPLWERPEVIDMGIQGAKYVLLGIVLLILYLKVLKPMLKKLNPPPLVLTDESGEPISRVQELEEEVGPMGEQRTYQQNLEAAKELARKDPKVVANIVKAWVGNE
ncbi:flagellar basal-body MS-ring/collar protein FliF [Herminiimonas fonticola]|uniref:Flagellar M-ring protein n=1 Tax=Herminiimonas fonticola TaxID=303380 RepID=A0A4R6GIQ6_9BURK|nr:fliF: flagellar M-ring protein FliF [Herminiimonas fonticola]TDN94911.1 flagellar M-ring protein FliF [Herminiimonas fonticola]